MRIQVRLVHGVLFERGHLFAVNVLADCELFGHGLVRHHADDREEVELDHWQFRFGLASSDASRTLRFLAALDGTGGKDTAQSGDQMVLELAGVGTLVRVGRIHVGIRGLADTEQDRRDLSVLFERTGEFLDGLVRQTGVFDADTGLGLDDHVIGIDDDLTVVVRTLRWVTVDGEGELLSRAVEGGVLCPAPELCAVVKQQREQRRGQGYMIDLRHCDIS